MRRALAALFTVALIAALGALLFLQVTTKTPLRSSQSPRPALPSGSGADLGIVTNALAQNWHQPWSRADLANVSAFERASDRHASVIMWFSDWTHARPPTIQQLQLVAAHGSTPEITWEPQNAGAKFRAPQPAYRLTRIIHGDYDWLIWQWAAALRAWGKPIRLRFAQEMNGQWYPWDEAYNGNRPGEFVAAWNHVHHIFDLAGAGNVQWVWSPVPAQDVPYQIPTEMFPRGGVDWLGITCLNGGRLFGYPSKSFAQLCGRSIQELHAMAPRLPIEISEAATTPGPGEVGWINGMFAYLRTHRFVRSVVWFDLRKETDWTITSSPAVRKAFAAGAARLGMR